VSASWETVQRCFLAARALDPGERNAYLDAHCPNAELRTEVESLLRYDGESSSPLDTTLLSALPLGTEVGGYRLLRLLGAGGMGIIFEAQQEHPTRRVAVKLLAPESLTRTAELRFRQEVQILAHLEHEGIARIYDAGVHSLAHLGCRPLPFFVMEYISAALPVSEYADRHAASIPARIDLMVQACAAVHHGHQRGVLHRDLKPANLLVAGSGQLKIIDFGIARVMHGALELTSSPETGVGTFLGTLAYMSPEQCGDDPADLDVRSDVYSLGVILYELLCGAAPLDLPEGSILQAAVAIREQEPPPPSRHRSELRGDLDTILQKALEKDRERRYGSALDFCEDLVRHLEGRPIRARAPRIGYLVSRWARRHRVAAAGVAIAVLALAAGGVASTLALVRAVRAEAAASREADAARREAAEAGRQRQRAERESRRQGIVLARLGGLLAELTAQASGRDARVDRSVEELIAEVRATDGDLLLAAELLEQIGWNYRFADPHLRAAELLAESRALLAASGETTPADLARVDLRLAVARATESNPGLGPGEEDALDDLRSAIAAYRRWFPDGDTTLAAALGSLAVHESLRLRWAAAEALHAEALGMLEALENGESVEMASALYDAAKLELSRGAYPAALPILERALGLDPPRGLQARLLLDRALALQNLDPPRLEDAGTCYADAFACIDELDIGDQEFALQGRSGHGHWLLLHDQVAEAREAFDAALERARATLGETHPLTLHLRASRGSTAFALGAAAAARRDLSAAVEALDRAGRGGVLSTASHRAQLAAIQLQQGELEAARSTFERTLDDYAALGLGESMDGRRIEVMFALCLLRMDEQGAFEQLLEELEAFADGSDGLDGEFLGAVAMLRQQWEKLRPRATAPGGRE
jgi:tetratricopeptide (TPR) repeat protein